MSISLLRQLLMKEAVKKSAGSSGIMSINKNIAADVDKLLQKYINDAMQQGVDIETLSPDQLKMIVAMNKPQPPKIYSGQAAVDQLNKLFPKKGEVVEFPQKTSFKEQIDAMRKSGDIVDSDDIKISEKITDRDMFNNSFLNKPTIEGQMEKITGASNKIKQIQKEQADMYRPKTDAEIKAKYDKQNKESVERLKKKKRDSMPIRLMKNFEKELNEADLMAEGYSKDQANVLIKARKKMTSGEEMNPNESLLRVKEEFADNAGVDVEDFKDIDFEIDIPDYATGGRAGFYTGGITDVEPSLDDIGHGSDAMMSRTRLMSPGSQATTSTGLNYLLAEDNDNMRIPFSEGKNFEMYLREREGMEKNQNMERLYKEYLEDMRRKKVANQKQMVADGGRIGFSTGKLAGGMDLAIAESKALEERIARQKRMTDKLNKMYDERAIKNAPEGVLMDPPFKPLDRNALKDKFDKGGIPPYLRLDDENYVIPYDDGTIYYKDTGEYYNDDGTQVPGPSEGAKIIPREMEAAEGGRIGFAGGGDPRRRAFLKLMATLGGGIAGLKTGMVGLGEGGAKKAITETVKQSAGGTYPPPYFFKLVEKIKFMGDDITEKAATQEREIVKRYKDYEMTEDIGTGNIVIKKRNEGVFYDQDGIISDEYIVYKPGQADELTKGKKPPPEYDEYTVRPDSDGKLRDSEDGLDSIDEILEEVGDTTAMTLKKADGGRIGYVGGGLSKLGITGSSRKFLEKVFGKEKFKNLIENDPEMHRGLLEVAEMFRSKDKAGLVEYMQNFLPQMSKKELEAFVVGSGDTAGIEGQLIRLGSGRDYKNKIEMIEEANNIRKLKDFDVEDVSKNAEGGRIGFSGGGIYRAIMAKSAAKAGMKPYEYIRATSYKSLPPEVKMFMSKADFEKLKSGQEKLYGNYIDMAKTRLNFQKEIEGGKKTPARELFESMEKTMDEQSYVPKNVNEKDIGEMELMFKNRFLKDRKDNAEGGIQTMLGE